MHTDIVKNAPFIAILPKPMRADAYLARLDRPIGTWLLLIPCFWGYLLAGIQTTAPHDFTKMALYFIYFSLGAILLRGAGCTWNDILDRKIDAKVARTQSRPLPSGDVSVGQALIFLIMQIIIGFIILYQFPLTAILVGAASLFLILLYPLMKRITYWPQAWLGLTFNWGVLLGYASYGGAWPGGAAILLYIAGLFWTLGYDSIYALQDKEDDKTASVKSTALLFGDKIIYYVMVFYFICHGLIAASAYFAKAGVLFWPVWLLAFAHLTWQARLLHFKGIDSRENALDLFKSNRDYALMVASALFFGLF